MAVNDKRWVRYDIFNKPTKDVVFSPTVPKTGRWKQIPPNLYGPIQTANDGPPPPPPIEVIGVTNGTPLVGDVGQTGNVDSVVQYASTVGTGELTYTSSDELVATVDASGLVTYVSSGLSSITATSVEDPSFSGPTAVTVNAIVLPGISLITGGSPDECFACIDGNSPGTVYHNGAGADPVTGDIIYLDPAGTNPFNGGQQFNLQPGVGVYQIDFDGTVMSDGPCPVALNAVDIRGVEGVGSIDAVTACAVVTAPTIPTLFYVSLGASPIVGDILYQNQCGSAPIDGQSMWYRDDVAAQSYQVDASGEILAITACV